VIRLRAMKDEIRDAPAVEIRELFVDQFLRRADRRNRLIRIAAVTRECSAMELTPWAISDTA
jgi:hypothetical protein